MRSFTMTHACLSGWADSAASSCEIVRLTEETLKGWLSQAHDVQRHWVKANGFEAKPRQWLALPGADGLIETVLFGCVADDPMALGGLASQLPEGVYHVEGLSALEALSWVLEGYRFDAYLEPKPLKAHLIVPDDLEREALTAWANSIAWGRDLINRPTQDLSPLHLAQEAEALCKAYEASITVIQDNLASDFPAVHAVGRAAVSPSCLIDFSWGDSKHFALTLVGKGVCFDTGGLNLKNPSGMLSMKKDMGGAAHVLVLARMIMALNLPIHLRVLIPAVENAVSGDAYRPGDVIRTRSGKTVEVGNTDAEGRLILCDALTYAQEQPCDWLIDVATLTGAARVALGTELPAFFSTDGAVSQALMRQGAQQHDRVWAMPLYAPYRHLLDSPIADLNNVGKEVYGGAITAALFLQDFVEKGQTWMHFDLMAENRRASAGRPKGGEIMGMRALFALIAERCQSSA